LEVGFSLSFFGWMGMDGRCFDAFGPNFFLPANEEA
jgi:hypothetical protein